MTRTIRLLALLLCSACVGGMAPALAQGAAAPRAFYGVNPIDVPTADQYSRIAAGGVGTVRFSLEWSVVQPQQGAAINWSQFDQLVGGAARVGIGVVPVLFGTPAWAGPPTQLPVKSPVQRDSWVGFVRSAVQRYGAGGEFWALHGPGSADPVPYHPITNWQIWNEENYFYSTSHPNPRTYAQLLRITSPAIKGADPAAQIVLGGMFGRPNAAAVGGQAITASRFLERLYRVKGAKGLFDSVALHPYTKTVKLMVLQIEDLRSVMRRAGDAKAGLLVTEMGWGSGGDSPLDKTPQGQAKQVRTAFGVLARNRKRWRIEQADWFALSDQPPNQGCIFCDSTGLFTTSFAPKPAWFAYVATAGGRP